MAYNKEKAKKELQKRFGNKVKELREARKMNKTEFGDLMGKDIQQVSKIENGVYNIGMFTQVEIALALGVKMGDLFDFEINDLLPAYYNKGNTIAEKGKKQLSSSTKGRK
jgi:transcriptional regulator with XRE-family HTH domain